MTVRDLLTQHLAGFDDTFKAIQDIAKMGMSRLLNIFENGLGTKERSDGWLM